MKVEFLKPTLADIPDMLALVAEEVEKGVILYRSGAEIATTIRSYTILKKDGVLIGFVALHIHSEKLCEIRSLIISESERGSGYGSQLVEKVIEEAKRLNAKELIVLTYNPSMYPKFDFVEIDKESLPEQKIWTDCIKCKHFPVCNEILLIKTL